MRYLRHLTHRNTPRRLTPEELRAAAAYYAETLGPEQEETDSVANHPASWLDEFPRAFSTNRP
jgi:hypothetical protein